MHWANQFEALTKATGKARERRTNGFCSTSVAAQSSEVFSVLGAGEVALVVACCDDRAGLVGVSSLLVRVFARVEVRGVRPAILVRDATRMREVCTRGLDMWVIGILDPWLFRHARRFARPVGPNAVVLVLQEGANTVPLKFIFWGACWGVENGVECRRAGMTYLHRQPPTFTYNFLRIFGSKRNLGVT